MVISKVNIKAIAYKEKGVPSSGVKSVLAYSDNPEEEKWLVVDYNLDTSNFKRGPCELEIKDNIVGQAYVASYKPLTTNITTWPSKTPTKPITHSFGIVDSKSVDTQGIQWSINTSIKLFEINKTKSVTIEQVIEQAKRLYSESIKEWKV